MDDNILNERRKNVRITYKLVIHCSKMICESKVVSFDSPVEMNVKNISPEGLCISSTELFEESSVLRFDMELEEILYQGLSGTVIWRTKNDDIYYYGLNFQNISGRLSIHIIEIGRKVFSKI